jgi:hypothetical protein
LKHKVFNEKTNEDGITNGIMQITDYKVYDIKYVFSKDLSYNSALGTGQLQIRDIHYVDEEKKTTEECVGWISLLYKSAIYYEIWYEVIDAEIKLLETILSDDFIAD